MLQKLVFIPDSGKPLDNPSSCTRLCQVNTIHKLFERMTYNRLLTMVGNEPNLSDKQFGYRKAMSTANRPFHPSISSGEERLRLIPGPKILTIIGIVPHYSVPGPLLCITYAGVSTLRDMGDPCVVEKF